MKAWAFGPTLGSPERKGVKWSRERINLWHAGDPFQASGQQLMAIVTANRKITRDRETERVEEMKNEITMIEKRSASDRTMMNELIH